MRRVPGNFEAVEGWRRSNRRLLPHPISHGRIALPRQPRTRPDVNPTSDNTDGIIIASIVQFWLRGARWRAVNAPHLVALVRVGARLQTRQARRTPHYPYRLQGGAKPRSLIHKS